MHGKYAYLACEDGAIKIFKVKDSKVEFVRSLLKMESRCLSVELLNSKTEEKQIVETLFAGYSDSSIRKWDVKNNNSVLHF